MKILDIITENQQGVAEGDYPDGSSLRTPSVEEWKLEFQKAKQRVMTAKTQQEYEAASDRASTIKDLLASRGVQVGPVLGEQDITEASGNAAKMARVAKRCARQAFKDTDRPDSKMFLKAAEYFAAGDEAKGLRTIERMDTEARDDFYMGCEDAGIPLPTDDATEFPDMKLTPAQEKQRKAMHKAMGLPLDEDQTK